MLLFRIWDYSQNDCELETIKNHSEFTYGLDWNALRRHQLADCGWDSLVHVFVPKCLHDK
jgi:peroxin-7